MSGGEEKKEKLLKTTRLYVGVNTSMEFNKRFSSSFNGNI